MPAELLQVDQNLQAIRAIEGAWSLPSVPDEVKLDLAGNTMLNPTVIGSLFNGLADDLDQASKRHPLAVRDEEGPRPQVEKRTKAGLAVAGLFGLDSPQVYDIRAPQRLKQRLSDGGYLDLTPEEIESDTWLPEYSFAASQLNRDDMSAQFRGEKPGSLSIDQIFGFVDEWLSPRGLYRAAVELDLWWDMGQITTEFEEWGDKLEAWNEDKFNVRKLIDVATGPLDDLLFPALNLALMFTGFTSVVAVTRGLKAGTAGAKVLAGTYRGAKGSRFAAAAADDVSRATLRAADDITRMAQPSFISRKLGNPVLMDAWRRNSGVILAKKANQQAMKAGFSSNFQQLIDADRGGTSLDHFTDGAAGAQVYETFSNPLFDWGVDILFMPTNIWAPGTFVGPAKAVFAKTQRGFRIAAENQDLLLAWDRPVRTFLAEMDPAEELTRKILQNLDVKTPKAAAKEYKRLSRAVTGGGMSHALAKTFFGGDKEKLGAAMGFTATMAGFDLEARTVANAIVGKAVNELDSGTRYAFHQARDQLAAQLKIVDPDDVGGLIDHFAKYGDDATEAVSGSRRADVFYKNRRRMEEPYFESVESMLERNGRVADGHTRYVGQMDPETGQIGWKPIADEALPSGRRLYHGTAKGVEDIEKTGRLIPGRSDALGEGVYLTSDPAFADQFTFGRSKETGAPERVGKVFEVDVPLKNTLDVATPDGKATFDRLRAKAKAEGVSFEDLLRGEGYDSVHNVLKGKDQVEEFLILGDVDVRAPGAAVDDPFFIDVHDGDVRRALGDDADRVLSGTDTLPDVFANRYRRVDSSGNRRYNRLSEAPGVRTYDHGQLEKLQAWAVHHNDLRAQKLKSMMDNLSPKLLEDYVYEVLPTFGRWDDFNGASAEIAQAALRGQLDNVKFVSPLSAAGRRLAMMPWTPSNVKWTDEMFSMLLELPGDEKLSGTILESVFSPFAMNVDPRRGKFTAEALETVTKQEARAFEATVRRVLKMVHSIRRIKALPDAEGLIRATAAHAETVENVATPGLREALSEAIGVAGETDTAKDLAALARYADEAGVTIDDVERVLLNKLGEINGVPDWAERFKVPTQVEAGQDVVQAVTAKARELRKQSYFMASEVEGAPAALTDRLREDGYKLVYGVEFAQPFELEDILPHFADAARHHQYQKAFGDFFSRQDPKAVSALKMRKVREALHATLSTADQEGGRALNFGDLPNPDNADQNAVLNDLWEVLHEVQEAAGKKLDSLENAHLAEKVATRASLARIPFDPTRLASDLTFKGFIAKMTSRGYSEAQARAMYKAVQKSQALGFRTHGLYAIESKLRSEPNLMNGLRLLGATAEGDGIRRVIRPGLLRAGMGSVAGGYAANLTIEEGEDPLSLGNIGKRVGGVALGGALGASRLGIPGVRKGVDALEKTRLLKYAYLADYTANIRDMVRFSLSPIFDASRYSEAIILNQLGDLPEGISNLRVNQTPSGFRKTVAREARAGGMSAVEATRHAKVEWKRYQEAFGLAANNLKDFDWEVIDGVGRRFSSVGILGFSPVDWMTSTFAHLVRGGAKERKAYEVVRDIYTYGTTGRSAAELSMNFVFFPFSFTKKTVGHFAKFFSDDLSRLIVTHDMLATYQLLNDKFNLSEEWRDRLPVLDKVHRLNLLAYGIGLGRFGGVNASIIEGGIAAVERIPGFDALNISGPAAIVNAFIPQMIPMNQTDDANSAWDTLKGLMPVMNDVTTLTRMLIDQGYVLGSEQHMTQQAEQRSAWDEWRDFQEEVMAQLEPAGISWAQATRNPELNGFIQQNRIEISLKYPSWKQGLGDGIAHATAIDMEMKERIQSPKSNADVLLKRFMAYHDAIGAALQSADFAWSRPESLPPEVFAAFRELAIEFSEQDPEFLRLYNRFFRRSLGDIMRDITENG